MYNIYTAIFGTIDNLIEPYKHINSKFICYTDRNFTSDTYQIFREKLTLNSRLKARQYKALSHLYVDEPNLWIDGRITVTEKILEFFDEVQSQDFAVFIHPHSATIRQEASRCIKVGKLYDKVKVERQIESYFEQGYQETFIAASGIIFRRNTAIVRSVNELWWQEIKKWETRDELSFPFVCWKLGFKPYIINKNLFQSPSFRIIEHITSK